MSKVKARAPGKLMLFGEHAVIYGFPCIVTAINKYLTVEVEKTSVGRDVLHTPQVSDTSFIKEAIKVFLKKFKKNDAICLTTYSEMENYGLGSSSAVTVATIKALAELCKISLSKKELFDLSYEAVLGVQKTASGFDVAASIFGGTILFDGKSKKVTKLINRKLPLMAFYTGKKASTVAMIDRVKKLKHTKPDFVDNMFSEITAIVQQAKEAIEIRDWETVGNLMKKNHELLVKLGISTWEIEDLVKMLNQEGAFGAKLSGAGGGDCVIAVVPEGKRKNIEEKINLMGFKIIDI